MFGYAAYAEAPFAALAEAGNVTFDVSVLESVDALDTPSGVVFYVYNNSVLEAAQGSETYSTNQTTSRSVSEASSAAITFASNGTLLVSLQDSASASETKVALATFPVSIIESSTGDGQSSGGIAQLTEVDDSASASETAASEQIYGGSVDESATGDISISSLATLNPLFIDASSIAESISTLADGNVSIVESAYCDAVYVGTALVLRSLEESAEGSITISSGPAYGVIASDALSASEFIVSEAPKNGTITEGANAYSFTSPVSVDFFATVSDTASGAVTLTGSSFKLGAIIEAATATPEFVVGGNVYSIFADTVTGSDELTPGTAFFSSVIELSSVTDQNSLRDFWGIINTYQPATWSVITTQT